MKNNTLADFHRIIARVKMHILREAGQVQGKVYDKDVAEEIGINYDKLRNLKSRNVTPYQEILDWCYKKGIDAREIFYIKY